MSVDGVECRGRWVLFVNISTLFYLVIIEDCVRV